MTHSMYRAHMYMLYMCGMCILYMPVRQVHIPHWPKVFAILEGSGVMRLATLGVALEVNGSKCPVWPKES